MTIDNYLHINSFLAHGELAQVCHCGTNLVVTLYRGDKDIPNGTILLPEGFLRSLPIYLEMF